MKYIVILVVTLGLLGGGVAFWMRGDPGGSPTGASASGATPEEMETYRVERRDLRVTIVETGQLKAKESVPVHSPVQNRHATIAFIADEGTEVEEGDVVLRFDPDEMQKNVEQLEPEMIEHEASLKSAQADLEIKQSTTQLDLDKAQLDFETAKKELKKALEGTLVLQEREATEAVRQGAYDVEQATRHLADSEELEKEDFLTPEEVEKARAALDQATSKHGSAKLKLSIFKEFTRPMEIRTRENTLASSEQQLENSKKKRESTLASAEASRSRAQRRLDRTSQRLEEAREDLEKMVVSSPGSGIIIFGDPDQPWYDAKPKVGDKVWPHQTILTLPVLTILQARFDIHESDIGRVKVDQTATITLEVEPDLKLTGTLTKIGSLATGRGNDPNVRKFDCEVTIDQESIGHKPGISARVELLIEELKDVLVIPVQAVHLQEGKHLVYVKSGGESEPREVTLGASTSSLVEIKEGLQEGEHILLVEPEVE